MDRNSGGHGRLTDYRYLIGIRDLVRLARESGQKLPNRERIREIALAASLLTSMMFMKAPDGIEGLNEIAHETWRQLFWEAIADEIRKGTQC